MLRVLVLETALGSLLLGPLVGSWAGWVNTWSSYLWLGEPEAEAQSTGESGLKKLFEGQNLG